MLCWVISLLFDSVFKNNNPAWHEHLIKVLRYFIYTSGIWIIKHLIVETF